MDSEISFYDKLYQRFPTNKLLSYLKKLIETHELETLHSSVFIEVLNDIETTNKYYAKNIVKVLTDNMNLFNEDDISQDKTIQILTNSDVYLSDWLYEKYIQLLDVKQPSPITKDIIQYRFNDEVKIKIEESPYLISAAGTTGFRTWEAAIYLTKFLIDNELPSNVKLDNILELGAGTGMVSLGLIKKYKDTIKKLYVTDGDSQLIDGQLSQNFLMNGIKTNDQVKLQKLWWDLDDVPNDLDLILAADVTYDSSVVQSLSRCILDCFISSSNPNTVCFLAATRRNEETLALFEKHCSEIGLTWEIIANTADDQKTVETVENILFKPLIAPIRIYKITYK